MKNQFFLIVITFTLIINVKLFAQEQCKVMVKDLQGEYVGGCKRGLANGQGTAKGKDSYTGEWKKGFPNGQGKYIWSTGEEFEGEWVKGLKNGYGVYKFKYNQKDTIISGIWKNDIYQGKRTKAPEIKQEYNIEKYQIRNVNAYQNRVLFDFWQNGSRNTTIEDLKLISTSGTMANSGNRTGFDNISFPVTIKVTYNSYNKFHTAKFNVVFEITIYEEGDYEIKLFN